MLFPIIIGPGDGEVFEIFAMAEKDRLERRHAERLAEAPRPRTKVIRTARIGDELMQISRLIHINLPRPAQSLKIGNVGCYRFHRAIIVAKQPEIGNGV